MTDLVHTVAGGAALRRLAAWACALCLAAGAAGAAPASAPPSTNPPPAPALAVTAATAANVAAAPARPRIGLVLSGGGARGYAHIGVLRVLEQLRVPVDIVVGTSMGSVVGGAYAAGRSPAELERFASQTDWAAVLADRPPRRDGDFRRREIDYELPSRVELGIGRDGSLIGPPAMAGSHALERALEQLLPPGLAQHPAGRLHVAFRAVATDLRTGELVELSEVPLAVALRASLSVPGLFPPLARDGRVLVDGGLVRNIPVDLARALGAEVLIVVNVGTPVDHVREIGSALGVAQQMINLLTEQNAQRSLAELRPGDVLIQPDLGGLDASALDTGAPRAIAAGEAAAQAVAERLARLAATEPAWQAFEQARTRQSEALATERVPARLLVQATDRYSSEMLAAAAGVRVGEPVDEAQARAAADRLYASGAFERVEVQSAVLPDGRAAILVPVPAPWRNNPLRLGLELQTEQGNRQDSTRFTGTALGTFSALNAWGAEARVLLRLGSTTTIQGEWWQPLGAGSPVFAIATWRRSSGIDDVYVGGERFTVLGVAASQTRIGAGLKIGRIGDLQLGVERDRATISPYLTGQDFRDPVTLSTQRSFAQLRVDTLDSVAYPTEGLLLRAVWRSRSTRGVPASMESEWLALHGFRLGRWGGHVYVDHARSGDEQAPVALGGFLRLSGTPISSLGGQSTALARVVMGRSIGRMPLGLGGPVRAGFSLETGGAWSAGQSPQLGEMRKAGSAFVSVDTRFGPVYLGLGATHQGGHAVYVFLGPFW